MSVTLRTGVSVVLCLCVLCPAQDASAQRRKARRVRQGAWGGEHILLNVGRGGGRVEFDCGGGTIDEPLLTDGAGRFDVKGTHAAGFGGPSRLGERPDGRAARYTGRVRGGVMTVEVKLADTGRTLGTFTLRHGAEPNLTRCH